MASVVVGCCRIGGILRDTPGRGGECWGSDEFGKASPPRGEFIELAASVNFTCGLRPSGEVECWGGDDALRHSKVIAPREPLVFIDAGWGGHDHSWPFQKPNRGPLTPLRLIGVIRAGCGRTVLCSAGGMAYLPRGTIVLWCGSGMS